MSSALAEWTLAALLQFAPPSRHERAPWADASADAALERYRGVAAAIVEQCESRREPRPCAALLVALAVGESGLARDADVGPCYRRGGYRTRCDSGRAASVWQVQAHGRDDDGPITVARLFASRSLAAGIALRVAWGSLSRCRDLPEEDRLAALGGVGPDGRCRPSRSARARWRLWQTVRAWSPRGGA
jgi:hypothetical protein